MSLKYSFENYVITYQSNELVFFLSKATESLKRLFYEVSTVSKQRRKDVHFALTCTPKIKVNTTFREKHLSRASLKIVKKKIFYLKLPNLEVNEPVFTVLVDHFRSSFSYLYLKWGPRLQGVKSYRATPTFLRQQPEISIPLIFISAVIVFIIEYQSFHRIRSQQHIEHDQISIICKHNS